MSGLNVVEQLVEYECGLLDGEGVLALFQELVDTGMAWKMQGSYGRMAEHLLDEGLITR